MAEREAFGSETFDCIDKSVMDELAEVEKEGAGEGFVAKMIDLFLSEMEPREQALQRAVDEADWQSATRMAHAIKGSCGHFGAWRLADLCVAMETAAGSAERDKAVALLPGILTESGRVRAALRLHQSRLSQ